MPPRIECTNNLKQLALAFHTYHDKHNRFPTENRANPSFYLSVLPIVEDAMLVPQAQQGDHSKPIRLFMCTPRRLPKEAPGKRDYGYAASTGASSAGTSILDAPTPVTIDQISKANGTSNTVILSHVWMAPKYYSGGDPTDIGWATKNNSRSFNHLAFRDTDPSGTTGHTGSVHPNGMPTAFADGHVQFIPYAWEFWAKAWAYTNTQPIMLP
ncbi:hypothetical protein AYO44_10320 [Planctomycetaceae bacterium SCGC AG-212-F19]|nr:hypothetical protein AYO44_10320 [Planctomycetaceae bacterium SCGC AG-212-F19]